MSQGSPRLQGCKSELGSVSAQSLLKDRKNALVGCYSCERWCCWSSSVSCCVVLHGWPWVADARWVGLMSRLLVLPPLMTRCAGLPWCVSSRSCALLWSKGVFLSLEFSLPLLNLSIAPSDGKDTTCQLLICLIVQLSTSAINLVTELKLSPNYIENWRGLWGREGDGIYCSARKVGGHVGRVVSPIKVSFTLVLVISSQTRKSI